MAAQAEENESNTQIVLLGTGTPIADPLRSGPSTAIVVNGTPYLIDFGPGVVRRAAAAHQMGIKGLQPRNLEHAFVTHLHSDHTAGYADLILSAWVLGRNKPLEVLGPTGISSMTDHILAAYEEDIRVRIEGFESVSTQGYKVIAHEIEPGVIYQDSNITVEAFQVNILNIIGRRLQDYLILEIVLHPVGILAIAPICWPSTWIRYSHAPGLRTKHPQEGAGAHRGSTFFQVEGLQHDASLLVPKLV